MHSASSDRPSSVFSLNRVRTWIITGALAALMTSAITSTASASLVVCNNTWSTLWHTHTRSDSGCPSNPWRQQGWWTVGPRTAAGPTCITIIAGSVTGMKVFDWAQNAAGQVWQSGINQWLVPAIGHNFCFNDIQQLVCTNAGSNCVNRKHRANGPFAGPNVVFTYSP